MIFLVLFGFIAVVVVSLNIYDNSNLDKIKQYLLSNNCQNIVYAKGSYKAICDDRVIQIENAFSVDLNKKDEMKIENIKSIEKKSLTLLVNKTYKIEFKQKENLENFYKNLEEKRDK
ncbi:MAG: hypothetical protein ACNI25_16205 [Halarcobacter sp.]